MLKTLAVVVIAAVVAYGAHALAQVRTELRPPLAAIGSSSSNGVSFAWFYDATERGVVVCRIGPAATDQLDCKAHTRLP